MIIKFKKNKKNQAHPFVEPDEIFLDSRNIENFDQQQFEGRIEKAISKKSIIFLGTFFFILFLVFSGRLGYLQIAKGSVYTERSYSNTLEKKILFSDRGIIYDRNKVELAWNVEDSSEAKMEFSLRKYLSPGFSHLIGYIGYPQKDKSGKFWQIEYIGKDGLEKEYNDLIKGINGEKIIETDVQGNIHSENIVNTPLSGKDLVTTIDSRIQKEIFTLISNASKNYSFKGGAAVVMDIHKGEVIALTSFPEYDSEILSRGKDNALINSYLTDKRKIFLDRSISGLYTPGSIVKPFFALGALNENIINPNKTILSTGSISIPNPYFKDAPTIFKDWKAHGLVDMRKAIAVSSDVYFYVIGGGFEDQKGIGIVNIEKYAKIFGIGEKTGIDLPDEISGVIPSPQWKAKRFNDDPWRVGDTYHTVIGQYGFQVTPLEMTRAISAIANKGTLPTPHLVLNDIEMQNKNKKIEIDFSNENYNIIHEGMREGVLYGTSSVLNVPFVKIASKTGTAQVGISKSRINSWITGFFPYENPKYAFTIMMEEGPAGGTIGASSVARSLIDWMSINTPEYFVAFSY